MHPAPRKPPPADDWRRLGQEAYLTGARLVFAKYERWSEQWDHDHCEFCGAKFMLADGELQEGYCTEDRYRWICADCFADFAAEFRWTLSEAGGE